jgi:hypothetical protein
MSYQLSTNLNELLDRYCGDASIDLQTLALEVARLSADQQHAQSLLRRVTGTMHPGTLNRYLCDGIASDSVVRDILTTGHLGKLLSRLDLLLQLSNPTILGLPNSLFDAQSQSERAEFFRAGNILPIDGDILNQNAVKEMLEREAVPT